MSDLLQTSVEAREEIVCVERRDFSDALPIVDRVSVEGRDVAETQSVESDGVADGRTLLS
jgi:hypothetical protein